MSLESAHSHLFSVRVWKTQSGDALEHRGRITHVLSGETRHFRSWSTLASFIVDQMELQDAEGDVLQADE